MAAYYAWNTAGTRCHVRRTGGDDGVFLESSSPYGPVGVLRAGGPSVLPALLNAIPAGRRYMMAPWELAGRLRALARFEEVERNGVYWLDRDRFSPATVEDVSIRVEKATAVGLVDDEVAARCSLLWQSPDFAELAVTTEPRFRQRGLARAVLSAMIRDLLERNQTPLHVAGVDNTASHRLAVSLGFTRCAGDEFAGYLVAAETRSTPRRVVP